MAQRKEVWSGTYDQIDVIKQGSDDIVLRIGTTIFPNKYTSFQKINTVSFTDPSNVTVFGLSGDIFVGKDFKLSLKIFSYDNGVILAEVKVIAA